MHFSKDARGFDSGSRSASILGRAGVSSGFLDGYPESPIITPQIRNIIPVNSRGALPLGFEVYSLIKGLLGSLGKAPSPKPEALNEGGCFGSLDFGCCRVLAFEFWVLRLEIRFWYFVCTAPVSLAQS